jgi:DNA-binding NarL/FixJ family response regulator
MFSNVQIRVVIIDDHPGVRTGIRDLLLLDKQILVVGEGESGEDALLLARSVKPDIMMLDVEMPRMRGDKVVVRLQKEHPDLKVLALSSHNDRVTIQNMLENGASAYIIKDLVPKLLIEAIHRLAAGESHFFTYGVNRLPPTKGFSA